MEKILLNIFIFNLLITISKSFIVFPYKTFQRKEPNEFESPLDIITYWDNNIIYSTPFIGTPSQEINIIFHSQNFSSNLYYHMCDIPYSSFEKKSSSSFSYLEKLSKIYPMENASLVSDKFYFYNDLNIKNKIQYTIPFIYSDNEKEIQKDNYEYHDYTCMSVGLNMNYLVLHEPKSNFITNLKKEGMQTYDYTLEYLDENNGRIIFGEEPYTYDGNKYNKRKYKISGAMNEKDVNSFFLNFDSIYMNNNDNKEEINSRSIKLIIDKGLILGPEDYKNKIKTLFFDDMIQKGKCHEKYIESKYFYWCDESSENDIKNNFPTLYFNMREYFKTFELTYDDLFRKKKDKIYFLIYFKNNNYNTNYFEIGKIFLKKYTLTFNQNNKHIGYYNKDIKLEGEDEEKNEKNFWKNKYLWIMIVILIILFSILGIILGKKFREHVRRKRINEVDDDNFDYDQPENDDKRLFKSDENTE